MRSRKRQLSALHYSKEKAQTAENAYIVASVSSEGRLCFGIVFLKAFHLQGWSGLVGLLQSFSISRRYDLWGYADFPRLGTDAYSYAEFTKTKWQNSSLYNL